VAWHWRRPHDVRRRCGAWLRSGYALPAPRPTTAIDGDSSQGNHLSEPKRCSDQPGHLFSGLLTLVRQLIDYGKQLAATLLNNPQPLGAGDIAQILTRITRGLLRAEALEARLIRDPSWLGAAPAPPRAPSHRPSSPARAAAQPTDTTQFNLDRLPTPEQIAAEVRRRPIGAVIADICRDLGIMADHPLWRELRLVVICHGGNLAKLMQATWERAFERIAAAWPAAELQSPAASGAGPP